MCFKKLLIAKTSGIAALTESRERDYKTNDEVQTDCNNTLAAAAAVTAAAAAAAAVQWLKRSAGSFSHLALVGP
jgi:hypothetical protein